MTIRIGFVTPYFYPYIGGVQKCVLRMSQNLISLGCSVEIITSDFSPVWRSNLNLSNERYSIRRLKCVWRIAEVPIVPELCREIGKLDVDVVHVNGMYPLFTDVAIYSAWKNQKPSVLNYHFDPISNVPLLKSITKIYNGIAPVIINKSTVIAGTGSSYIKSSPILSNLSRNIQVIPNAVENNFFDSPQEALLLSLREKLNISRCEKVVLFVGQLKSFKGIDVLLKAFKIVNRKVPCKLLIVGSGPEETFLKNLTAELGLSKNVIFAGYVDDIELPHYYHLCDVYVLPSISRIENFGITLLEAMASEKPVIASNLSGPNEVVENNVNGLLFQPGDFRLLASLLAEVLTNASESYRLGAAGKVKATEYSWKKISLRYLKLYKDIC